MRKQSKGFVGFSLKNWRNDTWEVDAVYPDTLVSREPRLEEKTIILKVNGQSNQEMQSMLQGPAGSSVSINVKKGILFHGNSCNPELLDTPVLCFGLHFIRRPWAISAAPRVGRGFARESTRQQKWRCAPGQRIARVIGDVNAYYWRATCRALVLYP